MADARFCQSCGNSLRPACDGCGEELPDGARFCPACGRPRDPVVVTELADEERRLITVIFADLAGFTSDTERSDPEDVHSRLTVYHRRAREDIERFGGRVEKLMGDGVFGVFGVPVAHEDDPERAVRALTS